MEQPCTVRLSSPSDQGAWYELSFGGGRERVLCHSLLEALKLCQVLLTTTPYLHQLDDPSPQRWYVYRRRADSEADGSDGGDRAIAEIVKVGLDR